VAPLSEYPSDCDASPYDGLFGLNAAKGIAKVKCIPLSVLCLAITPVYAGQLLEMEGASINVGSFHGVVFFTTQPDGYHIVVTIADGEAGLPVRFEASLTERQKLSITVPANLGQQSHVLVISRVAGKLLMEPTQNTNQQPVGH
jgi:hypothetical protein